LVRISRPASPRWLARPRRRRPWRRGRISRRMSSACNLEGRER
jgi:hypothetical protein